eukprot:jgi/Bigna1/86025/estExt_fgenesh1_pg.C_70284
MSLFLAWHLTKEARGGNCTGASRTKSKAPVDTLAGLFPDRENPEITPKNTYLEDSSQGIHKDSRLMKQVISLQPNEGLKNHFDEIKKKNSKKKKIIIILEEEDDITPYEDEIKQLGTFRAKKLEINDFMKDESLQTEVKDAACVLICTTGGKDTVYKCSDIIRRGSKDVFIISQHPDATEDAFFRQKAWRHGANMVTYQFQPTMKALKLIGDRGNEERGGLECPYRFEEDKQHCWCNVGRFSEDEMWYHLQLYHVNHKNNRLHECPVCKKVMPPNLQVHYRNHHGPVAKGIIEKEKRSGVFALAVCRRGDGRFLMTQEFAETGFWLPGGQLDPGESLRDGVIRECKEEAGVHIEIKGILEVLAKGAYWRRVTFYAELVDEVKSVPKTFPDYESAGAVWVHYHISFPTLSHTYFKALTWMVGCKVSADELEDKAKALKFSGYDETLRNALSSCVDNIIHELVRSASEPLKWIPFIAKGGKPKPLCKQLFLAQFSVKSRVIDEVSIAAVVTMLGIPDEHKELFKDVRL